ncbi:hypothetical protein [Streptomyces triticiradicis]|uniref:hypothetical protein n=1 Tax=Streptomyces triticiradicis TaxID=2651189 RepID=UPI001CEDA5B5|nr:hypothetical protein [Streptomyces triticiradicis]
MLFNALRPKALLVAAVAAGTLAATSAPASAAQNWQTVSTNSNWTCSAYKQHKVSNNVNFKVCIVVNSNLDAQAVLVVQNNASVAVSIGGEVTSNFGSDVDCAATTLNPGFTRGCFAPTVGVGAGQILGTDGRLRLNGVDEWWTAS